MSGIETALGQLVSLLVSGITTLAEGIATGVASMAKALFLETSEAGAVTGLSVFGGVIGIFAAISLAVGITTKVYTWITSLGN